jgi:hypothetical protein
MEVFHEFQTPRQESAELCFNSAYYEKLDKLYSEKWWYFMKNNITKLNFNNISSNQNLTLELVLNNLDLNWNWDKICARDFVTFDVVKKYTNLKWNFNVLLSNNNFTWTIINSDEFKNLYYEHFKKKFQNSNKCIDKNLFYSGHCEIDIDFNLFENTIIENIEINMFYVSQNPSITLDIIENNITLNWDWYELSRSNYITEEFLSKYINLKWDYSCILSRKDISWNFFEKYFDVLNRKYDDFMELISKHVNVTIDILEKYDNIVWDYTWVSLNPNINIEYVLNNLDKAWDWYFLTIHPNISFNDIKNNLDLSWNFNVLTSSIKVKIYDIFSTMDIIDWDLKMISYNPNIRESDVFKNIHFQWDWGLLSRNHNLNVLKLGEAIKNLMDFHYLSLNKYLTFKFIEKNGEKDFDWNLISIHSFKKCRSEFIKNELKCELLVILGKKLCNDVILYIMDF